MVKDESILNIYKTYDYDKFKTVLGNRNLSDKNYKKLIKSMQEKQLIIPILVNKEFSIIDGQHRYTACKTLGLPIFYYKVDDYSIEEVKRANMVNAVWSGADFLNLHCNLNKKDYLEFRRICIEYNVQVSQLIEIISSFKRVQYGTIKIEFEEGNFEFDTLNNVETFLKCLQDFSFFKFYNTPRFTKAFLRVYNQIEYDHKKMLKKLELLAFKVERKNSYFDYISLLVNDIYTYQIVKPPFKYDKDNNKFYKVH